MATALDISRIAAMVFALTLSSASNAMTMKCENPSQRKASVDQVTNDIDWFLSVVEDVPASVARQFRDFSDERAVQNATSHPLWQANKIRNEAAALKETLANTLIRTPHRRIKWAIMALGRGARFKEELRGYADKNPGSRIIDEQKWFANYTGLVLQLEWFALCLVDHRQ
jgi:hypothetical protein